MKRNRYWVMGAIATVIALLASYTMPFWGMLPAVSMQSVQSAPVTSIARSLQPQPVTSLVASDPPNPVLASQFLDQGRQAYQTGRYADAAQQFQQAIAAASQPALPLDQAQSWSFLALAQLQLGNWDAAARSLSQSFDLARRIETSREQLITLGRTLNAQGSLYFAKGQVEAALDAWKAAEQAYGEAQDETRQLGSLVNQSQALQSLGFYSRAQQILEAVHQRLDNQPLALQLTGLRNLGNMYWRVGDFKASRKVLLEAIDLAKRANQPPQLAAALLSLGNTDRTQDMLVSSLQHYEQAAQWGVGEIKFQATLNQFQLLLQLDEPGQARRLLPALESQLQRLPPSRAVLYGATHFAGGLTRLALLPPSPELSQSLGKSLMSSRKSQVASSKTQDTKTLQLATQILDWVIETAQEIGDTRAESYGRGYLGHLYENAEQWGKAQALTEAALTQAERINAHDIGYQWQWQLGRILKAQEQFAASKVAYQAAYETLQSLRGDLVAAQSDLQFSFRESIEPVYREYVDLLLRPDAQGKRPTPAVLGQARQVIESLQIAEINNFFRTTCIQDQAVALEEIDREGTAVIYPIILPDRLTIILSLPGQSLRSYTTEIAQSEVEQTLAQLRFVLEVPYTNPDGKKLGETVYRWLIAPLQEDLDKSQVKSLAFVLDGALRNVPMAALYDGEEYLVENYSIALTPGLQLLAPKSLVIQRERTLIAGLSEARDEFGALPYIEDEIAAIEKATPSKHLINEAFTHAALAESVKSSNFSVVHLATHGQFSSNAEETFILAWDERVKAKMLRSALQGRDRPEPIELLVLSACETASGDTRATLGLAGLSVQAGARSTLASLWSLNDESGARFIEQFYQALSQDGVGRAEALRRAQIAMLKQPKYENPIFWASYVLVGNWL